MPRRSERRQRLRVSVTSTETPSDRFAEEKRAVVAALSVERTALSTKRPC
jgi:hypothetical protein